MKAVIRAGYPPPAPIPIKASERQNISFSFFLSKYAARDSAIGKLPPGEVGPTWGPDLDFLLYGHWEAGNVCKILPPDATLFFHHRMLDSESCVFAFVGQLLERSPPHRISQTWDQTLIIKCLYFQTSPIPKGAETQNAAG